MIYFLLLVITLMIIYRVYFLYKINKEIKRQQEIIHKKALEDFQNLVFKRFNKKI